MKKTNLFIFLLVLFNLFFPKGGIKISEVPITIGMLLLIIVLFYQFFNNLYHNRLLKISKDRLTILYSWLPFQTIIIVCILFNGYTSLGIVLSMIFSFVFLPWSLIFIEGNHFDKIDKNFLFKIIKIGIIFISVFGIINFFVKYTVGEFIEIPFITVNYDDFGEIESKNLRRGNDLYKLISTYQNGNIYAASLLLLLPLFCYLERRTWVQTIVKLSILLTLSRTAWIGLFVYELIKVTCIKFSIKNIIIFLGVISILMIGISILLSMMGVDIDFIFDKNLGSRIYSLEKIDSSLLIGNIPIAQLWSDIIYANIMLNFGILGLIFFIIAILSPIIVYIKNKENNNIKKHLFYGYIIYLIISASDGALLLLPVMIFFWFVILVLTSKNLPSI